MTTSCGGGSTRKDDVRQTCTAQVPATLPKYDHYVSTYLDETTKHPVKNLGGQVVWNTRYYLESLITAYESTGNVKYLRSFEDTGQTVFGLLQTLTLLNVIDPSAPGQPAQGPHIDVTGWPTYMATFGQSISVPTTGGDVSLYAQSIYPRNATGPNTLDITQQGDGSLLVSWTRSGKVLKSYVVRTQSDLDLIAVEPLVFRQALGRIATTGLGLPAPGSYDVGTPLQTVWHAEQTGGILLSFARYLWIAHNHPSDADPALAAAWQSTILDIASQYEDHFLADGAGGYTLHNPIWMAHEAADTDAPADYIYTEASLRILLYELTQDSKHLSLARGLVQHQLTKNVPINANGWLVLRSWPDIRSWSKKQDGPPGSIWDSLTYDYTNAESVTEGGFFTEMLRLATQFNLTSTLGITAAFLRAQGNTFHQYLLVPDAGSKGYKGLTRLAYPRLDSSESDLVVPTDNPFASSLYLDAESATFDDVQANWNWMNAHDTTPLNWPIGYFLRAWANSEAAMYQACP